MSNFSNIKDDNALNLFWEHFIHLIGIKYRNPSETEKATIKLWYQHYHLSDELIKLTYDICIYKNGAFSIEYMNGILDIISEQGISYAY